ncbi:MAG TPA: hypothetical protein VJY62_22075 [Bacteroidia bacterium]|nr:hypothetical protein [Bacteroidia bacterium]
MKQLKGILICLSILTGAIKLSNAQSNNTSQPNDPSAFNSSVTAQQPDSTMQQSVTIAEPNATGIQQSTTSYRATEKIKIYSGSQSGVNVIKTIEVPLPENSPSVSEVYVPH